MWILLIMSSCCGVAADDPSSGHRLQHLQIFFFLLANRFISLVDIVSGIRDVTWESNKKLPL